MAVVSHLFLLRCQFTSNEIQSLPLATVNHKHKLILSFAYGTGFRVSEVINLKVKDVDIQSLTLHIKHTKCNKDRITIFPESVKNELTQVIYYSNSIKYVQIFAFTM